MSKSSTSKKKIIANQKERPSKWRGWLVIVTAASGLSICLYLYSIHVALLMGEIKSGILCGTENGLGCQQMGMEHRHLEGTDTTTTARRIRHDHTGRQMDGIGRQIRDKLLRVLVARWQVDIVRFGGIRQGPARRHSVGSRD